MGDMTWKEAIISVLSDAKSVMHYVDIAEKIVENDLRKSIGATPARTVSSQITTSLKRDGSDSPFIKAGKGLYLLKTLSSNNKNDKRDNNTTNDIPPDGDRNIIQAFGMFWQRSRINWNSSPKLLGKQQRGAEPVDFTKQNGVYLLYDRRDVVYIGRSIERPLGKRLYEHTQDRLSGRWDRFSWFGLQEITEDGKLHKPKWSPSIDAIISSFESLLIESFEPPQNRKRGDDFSAIEYLQMTDPEIEKTEKENLLMELKNKL